MHSFEMLARKDERNMEHITRRNNYGPSLTDCFKTRLLRIYRS